MAQEIISRHLRQSAVFVGLTSLLLVVIFVILHHPSPKLKPLDNGLPDYSGITVDHVIETVEKPDHGKDVAAGDQVKLRYRMWIYDPSAIGNHGKSIAAETDHEITVEVGHGDIIKGWDESLIGMKEGQESTLVIPPKLAYGEVTIPGRVPAGAIVQIVNTVLKIQSRDESGD